jgi:hypothetical protein
MDFTYTWTYRVHDRGEPTEWRLTVTADDEEDAIAQARARVATVFGPDCDPHQEGQASRRVRAAR